MKKTMFLSFFAAFLMTAFAFTPMGTANAESSPALFSTCTGTIQASVQCVTEDPANPIVTITNKAGTTVYSGPADGLAAAVTLAPGAYTISVSTTGHCQFTVTWEFCGSPVTVTATVNNGSAVVGFLEIC